MGSAAREASRRARRLPKRVKNAGAKEAACQNGSSRRSSCLRRGPPYSLRSAVMERHHGDTCTSIRYGPSWCGARRNGAGAVMRAIVVAAQCWTGSATSGCWASSAPIRPPRRSYVQFVRAGIDDPPVRPWKNAFGGLIVGSEVFASRVRRMLEGRPAAADVPQLRVLRPRPDLKRIAAVVAEHFGECGADWTAGRRSDDAGRAVAAYLAHRRYGYRATEVAATLGYRVHCSVTMAVASVEAELARLRGTLKEIENQLAVDN